MLFCLVEPADHVVKLGDDSWRVREDATITLSLCGPRCLPAVFFGLYSSDLEVVKRCRLVLSRRNTGAFTCAEKVLDATHKPEDYPFLDSVWYDTATKRYNGRTGLLGDLFTHYISQTHSGCDDRFNGVSHSNYRRASRLMAIDAVAWGVPLWVVRASFAELRRRDAVYLSSTGQTQFQKLPAGEPDPDIEP